LIDRLLKIGFKKVGEWLLVNNQPVCTLEAEADSENVLYSFVSNGEVLYIGKTIQPLKRRLYGYQKPGPTQTTNAKGNTLIVQAISSGQPVSVFALPDHGLLHYGGFHINLAAGLEDSLIKQLKPKWNQIGLGS
jgi:hypothetical protein